MSEKKVVAVIVEGPSDENALGGILKEFFSSEEVQFAVVHGYNMWYQEKIWISMGDFVKIIHIADTDGVFTKNCIEKAEVENIQYYEDHIEYFDVEDVVKRNEHKTGIIFKLYTTGKIRNIPYRLYFNSCNLEHVLYNELKDFTDDEKEILSDEFAEKYEGKVSEFIEFISDKTIAVDGTYKETWKYIEKDKNSIRRHSNMHLMFETK